MRNLKELKVLTEEEVDTLFILQWPPGIQVELEAFVIPVAKRKDGVLLAVPLGVIPKEDLDNGATSSENLMVGPSKLVTVPGVEEDENGADAPSGVDITLMLVDFNASVLPHIREYDPSKDLHEIHSFLEDAPQVLPSSNPLLQSALDWMGEEVSGRVQYYSAEENAPAGAAVPLPPKKSEAKKRITNAALAEQLSQLSDALPGIMQELEGEAGHLRRSSCQPGHTNCEGAPSQDAFPSGPTTVHRSRLCQEARSCSKDQGLSSPSDKDGRSRWCPLQRRSQSPCSTLEGGFRSCGRSPFRDTGNLPAKSGYDGPCGTPCVEPGPPVGSGLFLVNFAVNQRCGKEGEASATAIQPQWGFLSTSVPPGLEEDQASGPFCGDHEGLGKEGHLLEVHGEARRHGRAARLCPGDVVALPDRGCHGGPGSQRGSRVAGGHSSGRRAGINGRRQMGSCVSPVASTGSPPVHLYLSNLIDQSETIVCAAMPTAVGHHGPSLCQGAGCHRNTESRGIRIEERRSTQPGPARWDREPAPEDQISQKAKERRRRQRRPVAPFESAASWTSPVGRRDDDPSLCSGQYACQAGCDERGERFA